MRLSVAVAFAAVLFAAAACAPAATGDPPVVVDEPDVFCPGGPGCAAGGDDALLAGAAAVAVTPTGFEIANVAYLDSTGGGCAPEMELARCGVLRDTIFDDCGRDGLCPGEEGYAGADADGSQGDGDAHDWFLDCGRDRLCAGDDGYAAPDADGSEGDGLFQGLWIAGYDNSRPAMGVKDDLWARAVVLQQGESTLALVVVDAVGLFHDEQVRIRARVDELRPGAVDLLLVQSTHTHEAPDTMGQWGLTDPYAGLQLGHGRDDDHMERIRAGAADAIVRALDGLAPVDVHVGIVRTGAEGMVRDTRAPRIFNDALTAIELVEQGGASVATIVNWGNHPEALASRNNFVSSDFPHALRRALEDGLPATDRYPAHDGRGGVAIYAQGAVGGLMAPNGFPITARDGTVFPDDQKTYARCDAYGEALAEHAFQALDAATRVVLPTLRFSATTYAAPVKNGAFHVGMFSGWFDREVTGFDESEVIGEGNWPQLTTAVGLVFLGPIGFVTAPGELFPETFVGFDQAYSLGQATVDADNPNPPDLEAAPTDPTLRDLLGVEFPMALGLCQDEIGYLVPPYDFELDDAAPYIGQAMGDHYEETNSIGPEAVPLYLEHAQRLFAFEAGRVE